MTPRDDRHTNHEQEVRRRLDGAASTRPHEKDEEIASRGGKGRE